MGTKLWKEVYHDRQCQEAYLYLFYTFCRRKGPPEEQPDAK